MKFYEKYPQLKDRAFLTKVLTDTIYSTMALEDQTIEETRVEELVESLLHDAESKGPQFFSN